ncbi:hypothetical protein [Chelativorans sp.]|uniref:hypothetical protein n=1 Tax=Chelativorans sp. TaxID=2203393 RepID=UPI0028113E85|nr:hypothetical protein [Chelativorans sp.]
MFTDRLGETNEELTLIQVERAARDEQRKHLNDRLQRIEASIAGIQRLGWWVLATFSASAVALISNFLFRGGFHVP